MGGTSEVTYTQPDTEKVSTKSEDDGTQKPVEQAYAEMRLLYEEQQLANCGLQRKIKELEGYIEELEAKLSETRPVALDKIIGDAKHDIAEVSVALREFVKLMHLFDKRYELEDAELPEDYKLITASELLSASADAVGYLMRVFEASGEVRASVLKSYGDTETVGFDALQHIQQLATGMLGELVLMIVCVARDYKLDLDQGVSMILEELTGSDTDDTEDVATPLEDTHADVEG